MHGTSSASSSSSSTQHQVGDPGEEGLTILVVGGLDLESAGRLATLTIIQKERHDLLLVGGPFNPPFLYPRSAFSVIQEERPNHVPAPNLSTLEGQLAAEGDMTAILSLLESIVCRCCYIPSLGDPKATRGYSSLPHSSSADPASSTPSHPRLTPNSINLNDRVMQVLPDLYVGGHCPSIWSSERSEEQSQEYISTVDQTLETIAAIGQEEQPQQEKGKEEEGNKEEGIVSQAQVGREEGGEEVGRNRQKERRSSSLIMMLSGVTSSDDGNAGGGRRRRRPLRFSSCRSEEEVEKEEDDSQQQQQREGEEEESQNHALTNVSSSLEKYLESSNRCQEHLRLQICFSATPGIEEGSDDDEEAGEDEGGERSNGDSSKKVPYGLMRIRDVCVLEPGHLQTDGRYATVRLVRRRGSRRAAGAAIGNNTEGEVQEEKQKKRKHKAGRKDEGWRIDKIELHKLP